MRFNQKQIKSLQKLLKEQTGKDYTDEEAQQAGLAIVRFVLVKESAKQEKEAQPERTTRSIKRGLSNSLRI